MTYFCEDCGFVFYGAGEIRDCPYCGNHRIHSAAEADDEKLRHFLKRQDSDSGIKEGQAL